MRARIGDLAIVRFDPDENDLSHGKKYDEQVGLVIGCCEIDRGPREYKFIYWNKKTGGRLEMITSAMTSSRLVRARPKRDDWNGTLQSLTRDKVGPV